jgi:tetratricopeptide (TPR) repeat protein
MKVQQQARSMTPGRNDPCPCDSGRKYKHCCADKDRASALQADFVSAQTARGLMLESQGRIDEAIEAYRVAAACGNALEALSRLGHLYTNRGLPKAASDAFRAAAAGGGSAERRLDLVRALMIEGKDAEAEAEVRRALTLDRRSFDAFWLLGRILSEAGRFAEARAALERAVALEPGHGAAYYDLVRSFTIGDGDRMLVEQMLKATTTVTETDQRVRLHFALGKTFDDLKDFGSAMRHFEEANRIKATLGAFDRDAFLRTIDGLIERFTPEFTAAHVARGDTSDLPVMIVGMPRSGTTLVEQILSSHDAIAGGGEMQFWSSRGPQFLEARDDAAIAEYQGRTARDGLETLRAIAPGARRVTDKNPFNFLWAGAIHLTLPRAVIIHCRRNPIDTCLSIFSNYFRPRADFSTDRGDLVFYYRQYLRLTAHWRRTLPPGRFVEVDYEALVAHPEEEARRLLAACGLEWQPQCLRPQDNTRVVRSASRWQARQPIHGAAVERWRRYEPWIGALRDLEANAIQEVVA